MMQGGGMSELKINTKKLRNYFSPSGKQRYWVNIDTQHFATE
jgi:hypothetical protein